MSVTSQEGYMWLKLPPNIRQMEEKEEFKKATKKHFGL